MVVQAVGDSKIGQRLTRHADAPGVPVLAAKIPIVNARKLLGGVVQGRPADLPARQVDGPALQTQRFTIGTVWTVVEHALVDSRVDNHRVLVQFETVGDMEQKAGVHITPNNVPCTALPGQQSDPGRVLGVPSVGKTEARRHGRHGQGDRQIEDHCKAFGEGALVNRRAIGHRHAELSADRALPVDHHMPDPVRLQRCVRHCVPFAGSRVLVGVSGKRAGQRTIEICIGHGIQTLVQLGGGRTGLHQGQRPAGKPEHVGIHRVPRARPRARCGLGTTGGLQGSGTDVAIVIPLGPTVGESYTVHHAITQKPVMAPGVRCKRIGTDTGVTAGQGRWNIPAHLEISETEFLCNRGVNTGQERMFAPGILQLARQLVGSDKATANDPADGVFHRSCHSLGLPESLPKPVIPKTGAQLLRHHCGAISEPAGPCDWLQSAAADY